MFGWFDKKAREIRQLNRDAPAIIESARQSYRTELIRSIARLTDQRLQEAKQHCGDDAECLARAVSHFQTLHRESRSKNEHVGLTAYTLIIIYLRALVAGEACVPARTAIDAFLDDWRHTFDKDNGAFVP